MIFAEFLLRTVIIGGWIVGMLMYIPAFIFRREESKTFFYLSISYLLISGSFAGLLAHTAWLLATSQDDGWGNLIAIVCFLGTIGTQYLSYRYSRKSHEARNTDHAE